MASQEHKYVTGLTANQCCFKTMWKWPSAPPLAGNLNETQCSRVHSGNVEFYAVNGRRFYAANSKESESKDNKYFLRTPVRTVKNIST